MRLHQSDEDSLKAVSPGAINQSEQGDEDDSEPTRVAFVKKTCFDRRWPCLRVRTTTKENTG